jgi:hypothetical protein
VNFIDKFSLQKHEGKYENRPLKSLLYYKGRALGIKVPGYIIDKQFEFTQYFLLFLSWDCPFEEGCEIIVLNKQHKRVAHYSFNAAYNSYHLQDVIELSDNHYKLIFNTVDSFELTINYPKKHLFSKVINLSKIEQ